MKNIDAHSHFIPPDSLPLLKELGIELVPMDGGMYQLVHAGHVTSPVTKGYFDPESRLKELDKLDIDVQVVSAARQTFLYEHPDPKVTARIARHQNESVAKVTKQYDRFVGTATLPLQDMTLALREMDYAYSKLELRGLEIATNLLGKNLDDDVFLPFYERLESYRWPMMIHPDYMMGAGTRLNKYYSPIMIGAIFETTIAFTYLVLGQIMDRFPNLKIMLCHGGGAVPYQIGRIDHGSEVRVEARQRAKKKPSEYLRSFYYDTIVHTDAALEFLIKVVGADRVIFGTDYAMNMGEWDGLKRINRVNISESDKIKISRTNAAALYGL